MRRKTYRINGVPWSAAAGLSRGALRLISRGETERRAFYASPRERDEARAIKYARWLADRDEVDISAADTAEAVWHGSYIGAVRFGIKTYGMQPRAYRFARRMPSPPEIVAEIRLHEPNYDFTEEEEASCSSD